jgi:hypothetical protein
MNTKLIAATLFLSLVLATGTSWAGDDDSNPKLKSEGVATVLGLDPIPGDALFYAGKPVQGTVNLVLGGIGGFFFWWGLIELTECDNHSDSLCGLAGIPMMAGALGGYFPALIWDAIGGISGVKNHNKRVRQQSFLGNIHPIVSVSDKGTFGGLQVAF